MSKQLQKADDEYFFNQPGSEAGMAETLIEQDSPEVIPEVNKGQAVEKTIQPINASRGDDGDINPTDKDTNLHSQFVDTGAIDASSRK